MDDQIPLNEKQFFNQHANSHGPYTPFNEAGYAVVLKRFEAFIRPSSKKFKLIDLGCGTGAVTERFSRFENLEITACDISEECIAIAKSHTKSVHYQTADILNLPFDDRTFDIVTCNGVLHHFPNYLEVLKVVYRLLAPKGYFFGYDPNFHSPAMWLYRHPQSPFHSKVGKTNNEILMHRNVLLQDLKNIGFTQISVEGCGGITFEFVESPTAQKALPFYNVFEKLSAFLPGIRYFGSMLFTTARKD